MYSINLIVNLSFELFNNRKQNLIIIFYVCIVIVKPSKRLKSKALTS
jgi:hypothetical protein